MSQSEKMIFLVVSISSKRLTQLICYNNVLFPLIIVSDKEWSESLVFALYLFCPGGAWLGWMIMLRKVPI